MFASRGWMRVALVANLAGAILLFLSFQATSSNFRLISTKDGNHAICVQNTALVIKTPTGYGVGWAECPDWKDSRPAAIVNFEHPILVTIGFAMLSLGFLLQILAIPSPKTIAQMRTDIKVAKTQQRLEESRQKQSAISPSTKPPT